MPARQTRRMTTVLRLDPAYPTLWRDADSLQFGVEPVAVVDHLQPWQQKVLTELDRGIPEHALRVLAEALDVPDGEVRGFVAQVGAALLAREAVRTRVGVGVRADRDVQADVREAIHGSLTAAGFAPVRLDADERPEPSMPVILVAQHIVEPGSAVALVRDDVPHLPVVFSGPKVTVGPFVMPGITGCLSCAHAHRRDADPAWPVLAAQLIGRRVASVPPALAAEAGGLAARLLRGAWPSPDQAQRSVTLSESSARRVWTTHRPHADCACRSLSESATESVPYAPAPATTRRRAYARPA